MDETVHSDCTRAETCTPDGSTAFDEDRDGLVDEGCGCIPDTSHACCGIGIQICEMATGGDLGGQWGECLGGRVEPEICGDGIDQDCDGLDLDCPDVDVACESSPHETVTINIDFAGNGPNCPWSTGDNSGPTGGVHAARIEHETNLDLPTGAIICDMDFDIPGTGMYYDDVFFLTMNDAILMAGSVVDPTFRNEGGLFIYDWADLHLTPFNYEIYCLGGVGSCSLPNSENSGTMSLRIPTPLVRLLSRRALAEHSVRFGVVVTGDDNVTLDCTYTAFTIRTVVDYVIP